jgi:peptidoglycan/LPS O-acetylase OafA/YrhL
MTVISTTTPATDNFASAHHASAPARSRAPRAVHIPALDGLRGLAIILVLLFHFALTGDGATGLRRAILHLPSVGWIGVDLFFVLSGFLITTILYDAKNTDRYFRNFYMRRVLRIFPLYYGVLIASFVVFPLLTRRPPSNAFANVQRHQLWLWLYGCNFVRIDWQWFTHFWSLAVEEQFYLVWPAVVFLLNRRALIGACLAMIAIALAIRCLRVATHQDFQSTYYFTFCRMDALAVGALLALVSRGPAGIISLLRPARISCCACGVMLLAIFLRNGGSFAINSPLVQTAGFSLLAFFFGGVLVLAVAGSQSGALASLLHNTTLRFFGKYSYGIYVLHGLGKPWLELAFPVKEFSRIFHSPLLGAMAHLLLSTAASVGAALVSWHLYEKHFLKLKRFFEYRAVTLTEPVSDAVMPEAQ